MKVNVLMPKMGESITEGTVIKWHKTKGDYVEKDEIIFEISTDKVDTEIPSPASGILADIMVYENETVQVDAVVAIIETEKENYEQTTDKITSRPNQEISTTQIGGEIIDVVMPKMGESIVEGTIIKWHKKVNDPVGMDEILFEISTDKVDTEVPSPAEGTLIEILFNENDTIEVGKTVARISTSTGIPKQKQTIQTPITSLHPESEKIKTEEIKVLKAEKIFSNRFYSPLVLNIAQTEGINLSELDSIPGTGLNGRLTKNDLLSYIQKRKHLSAQNIEQLFEAESVTDREARGVEIIPMDRVRQKVAEHMVKSRDTSVHVTGILEVDMSAIHNFLKNHKEKFKSKFGFSITYMAFIAYAAIKGLKEFPLLNASINEKEILVKRFVNLGIAVAVEPNGLIVPNIKDADLKSVIELAKSIYELGYNSRNKKLSVDDVMNGTFSITNYGVFGSLFGTPIINQPEVGILGVGAVTKKPVVIESNGIESIAIKPMMYLSLSHDHRLVDGMLGGKFLMYVKNYLENFDVNLVKY